MRSAGQRHKNLRDKDWRYFWVFQGISTVKIKVKFLQNGLFKKRFKIGKIHCDVTFSQRQFTLSDISCPQIRTWTLERDTLLS